ncbi:MAG: hypothetical protein R2939_15640 [Kofleriaceae bacterium]
MLHPVASWRARASVAATLFMLGCAGAPTPASSTPSTPAPTPAPAPATPTAIPPPEVMPVCDALELAIGDAPTHFSVMRSEERSVNYDEVISNLQVAGADETTVGDDEGEGIVDWTAWYDDGDVYPELAALVPTCPAVAGFTRRDTNDPNPTILLQRLDDDGGRLDVDVVYVTSIGSARITVSWLDP